MRGNGKAKPESTFEDLSVGTKGGDGGGGVKVQWTVTAFEGISVGSEVRIWIG